MKRVRVWAKRHANDLCYGGVLLIGCAVLVPLGIEDGRTVGPEIYLLCALAGAVVMIWVEKRFTVIHLVGLCALWAAVLLWTIM